MDPNEHKMTFMEVFRGLFNRFIDTSALFELKILFDKVEYEAGGGVEKLFSDLRDYAELMPIPPDIYNFKLALMRKIPNRYRIEITKFGISAEDSTVNNIVHRVLEQKRGGKRNAFYANRGCQSPSSTDSDPSSDEGY